MICRWYLVCNAITEFLHVQSFDGNKLIRCGIKMMILWLKHPYKNKENCGIIANKIIIHLTPKDKYKQLIGLYQRAKLLLHGKL